MSQLKVQSADFLFVTLIVFAVVWALGLLLFVRMLHRYVVIVDYQRAINRARRFFVDNDPRIERYLALPSTDSEPKYASPARSFGVKTTISFVSSLAFGLLCGALVLFAAPQSPTNGSDVIIGFGALLVHLVVLEGFAAYYFRNAEKRAEVRFPPQLQ